MNDHVQLLQLYEDLVWCEGISAVLTLAWQHISNGVHSCQDLELCPVSDSTNQVSGQERYCSAHHQSIVQYVCVCVFVDSEEVCWYSGGVGGGRR